jgi:DNA-binding response OmpR family regulator
MQVLKKILIVEDETALRHAMSERLSREEYELHEARDGEEGLAAALQDMPNLIILDLEMPRMDGTQMLKHLREDERGKKVKVIVLTNVSDLGKVASVMEDDATAYFLKKDMSLQALAEYIKSAI